MLNPPTTRAPALQLRFLEDDRLLTALLEATETKPRSLHRVRGSFGTMINRKRARSKQQLATRLLSLQPGMLEDQSPGMVELMLSRLHHWEFSAFLLDRFSSGNSLSTLCVHLFHQSGRRPPPVKLFTNSPFTGLISHFAMDPTDCYAFFRLVESGYHANNPYHTALHAADVTQAISVFISQPVIARHLTRLEQLAVLTAAVCHDLDHPGVNEKFLVSTGSHLAVLYDNVSVLENHHWRSAIACFVESGLVKYITEAQFAEFTDLVRSLILATDISRQQEFLSQFRHFIDTDDCDMAQINRRHFILQIAIKCADISNPCRAWPVSRLWSLRCCEEFFRQGDGERDLGLLLTPICDRFNVTVAKVQVGFYRFVAEPLFHEWHRFLASPLSEAMLANLYSNQTEWEEEVLQQEKTEVQEEEPVPSSTATKVASATATKATKATTTTATQQQFLQTASASPKLTRRLSLPATDPLHRIFDQMTQPDMELPRAAHLRRNFSLTDRRRSSLLRGLHGRSSLKPLRGRVVRPSSVCLENTENIRLNRTLQNRENRQNSMDVAGEEDCMSQQYSKMEFYKEKGVEKENAGLHSSYERLTRRRGSAPSNLVLEDSLRPNSGCVLSSTTQNLLRHQTCLSVSNRRGSLPSDLLNESLPKQFRSRMIQSSSNGNKLPGLLRRRSVGTELLSLGSHPMMKERQLLQKYHLRPF